MNIGAGKKRQIRDLVQYTVRRTSSRGGKKEKDRICWKKIEILEKLGTIKNWWDMVRWRYVREYKTGKEEERDRDEGNGWEREGWLLVKMLGGGWELGCSPYAALRVKYEGSYRHMTPYASLAIQSWCFGSSLMHLLLKVMKNTNDLKK